MQTIGVIGGSGFYELEGISEVQEVAVDTPFGAPSDSYRVGRLGDRRLVFLARHGRGHRFSPSEINYRANVWGMKQLGVEWLLSVSAVGSLREDIQPGHLVVIDQSIDRTLSRARTFFEGGVVAHVSMAEPVCKHLAGHLADAASTVGATVHRGGTYVCIEGPQFSTRAESHLYRSWNADVIGMTHLPEARLAREAQLCYATLALSTDYDCWHTSEEAVTVEMVVKVMKQNVANAQKAVRELALHVPLERTCGCPTALKGAVMSDEKAVPPETRRRVALLLG
ncbi:MAG: S-methyl-5'-thioadenosine phosphorylase [Myxococcales bacterium]|nr:S-methyl-5'-thioadenosine phosphorylase [Myxococcales bacterium]